MNKRLKKKFQEKLEVVDNNVDQEDIIENTNIKEISEVNIDNYEQLIESKKTTVKLRQDKVEFIKKLIEAYQKEEYMLGNIKKTIDDKDSTRELLGKVILSLRNDKINLANKLLEAYQKEEYLLNKIMKSEKESKNILEVQRKKNDSKIQEIIDKNEKEIDELNSYYKDIINELKEKVIGLRVEKIDVTSGLMNSYQKEEYLLKAHSRLLRKFEVIERRYQGLSNSKLGKLTLMLWENKKKLKSGGK